MATASTAVASSAATAHRKSETSIVTASFPFSPIAPGDLRGVHVRLQSHSAPAGVAHRAFGDQLDAGRIERSDQLHQRIDISAYDSLARLHALNCRNRQAGQFRERFLVDTEKRPRGA